MGYIIKVYTRDDKHQLAFWFPWVFDKNPIALCKKLNKSLPHCDCVISIRE
jgi:hypothetical protein